VTAAAPEPAGTYAAREKYDAPGRAARYARRSAARHRAEWRLLERLLAGRPFPRRVLDAPCGTGRLAAEFLARGAVVRGADLSPAMRDEAERTLSGRPGWLGAVALDLEAPAPPRELAADLVVCARFLHHLPDAAARGRVLATLAALARPSLLVTFHHPVSLHQLARAARRAATGRRGDRHAIGVARLEAEAAAHGLRLVRAAGTAPYVKDLWAALFSRV
jgi:SAM-dependent methyltransferase